MKFNTLPIIAISAFVFVNTTVFADEIEKKHAAEREQAATNIDTGASKAGDGAQLLGEGLVKVITGTGQVIYGVVQDGYITVKVSNERRRQEQERCEREKNCPEWTKDFFEQQQNGG